MATPTPRLNREVFARTGLPPDRLRTLLQILAEFRHTAGDFDTGDEPARWNATDS
ncbi:hypothetical protein [Nocardia cyriacigeorgica]|uniref:hypothetical protein n=1 Tax=Nocardia cyriacigeorgica TaxID=135487 RepID=UPI003D78A045